MPDPNNVALRDCGIVFMLLPKVANTSIKLALMQALDMPDVDPHKAAPFEYVSRDEARRFPVRISFVRNPLGRLASCYRDKLRGEGDWHRKLKPFGLTPRMTFREFVDAVAEIPDAKASGAAQHFRSQTYDLCDGDEVIPTFVGRFERLDEDWRRVQATVMANGGPRLPMLPHANQATGKMPAYCPRSRAFALHRYRDDVRIFDYQPPRKYPIDPDFMSPGRSICNVHREAYRLARDRVEDPSVSHRLMDLMAEAFDMGKRMNAKLGGSQYET